MVVDVPHRYQGVLGGLLEALGAVALFHCKCRSKIGESRPYEVHLVVLTPAIFSLVIGDYIYYTCL